eukprot:468168_1
MPPIKLRVESMQCPQQNNSNDCGLFLLHFAQTIANKSKLSYPPSHSNVTNASNNQLRPSPSNGTNASNKRTISPIAKRARSKRGQKPSPSNVTNASNKHVRTKHVRTKRGQKHKRLSSGICDDKLDKKTKP